MKKEVIKHLKGDIKNFHDEAAEDEKLINHLRGKKMCKQKAAKETPRLEAIETMHKEISRPNKVKKVMKEFKKGKLHSGSKKGPKVRKRAQAIAIALSESRKKK